MRRQGGFLVAKIHQTAGRIFARMLREREIEINPAQGRVLFVLWEEGPMPINELARRVSLSKSTLTNAIDRLEAQGHLVRVRTPEDRRQILVELTPKNKEMHAVYEQVSREMTKIFYGGMRGNEIAEFERSLECVLENLARYEQAHGGSATAAE